MKVKCVCSTCLVDDECEFYQEVVRPVMEIVSKNQNLLSSSSFIQDLQKSLEKLECSTHFRI